MTPALGQKLLVIDDEPDLRTLYELTLLREGHHVDTAGSVSEALQCLQEGPYGCVISDMRLPDGLGLEVIQWLDAHQRQDKVIVITAYGSAENAVSALKAGAYDYLTKPVDLKQFRQVVASALGRHGSLAQTDARAAEAGASETAAVVTPSSACPAVSAAPAATDTARGAGRQLLGHSPAIQQVRVLIDKVARSMAPVFISGESGTGKELVARAIHDHSDRRNGPFVAVNCGAIPEHLLEAEFFGYRRGSFTGAQEDRIGFFQAAEGGTLFLDEIGDLPLAMQSKLLRAIQERAVRGIGWTQETPVDVRVISATHKHLPDEVQAQRFRQDLYYRLNVIQISLPALRERPEDLPLLCERILTRLAQENHLRDTPRLGADAQQALAAHRFPGNVRELENLLQRAVALSNSVTLSASDLGLTVPASPQAASGTPTADATGVPAAPTPSARLSADTPPPAAPLPSDLVSHLDQVERDILVRALEQHRLNRTAAAASLGLSLRQIRYRMARLGVQVTDQGVTLGERFEPEADGDASA
jgi:two-component system response regulator PilR (NtrC family)